VAAASQTIYRSQLEGSSVAIIYDDATLLATGLVASCPDTAANDLQVTYYLPAIGTGLSGPNAAPAGFTPGDKIIWNVPRGSVGIQTTFATPLQGYFKSGAPVFSFVFIATYLSSSS
jgi:hypothetical protein